MIYNVTWNRRCILDFKKSHEMDFLCLREDLATVRILTKCWNKVKNAKCKTKIVEFKFTNP